jgi:hypothetical protein
MSGSSHWWMSKDYNIPLFWLLGDKNGLQGKPTVTKLDE